MPHRLGKSGIYDDPLCYSGERREEAALRRKASLRSIAYARYHQQISL
jgi:hypothetical protein